MKFESQKVNYVGRYGGFLIAVCMWLLFPVLQGDFAIFFKMINQIIYNQAILLILLIAAAYMQLVGFFISQVKTKLLSVLDSKVIFNLFSGKTIELNYSDISCLNYTQDIFKNFQFTLKNGEVKVVCATVKNQQQAFELIQQKIRESQT